MSSEHELERAIRSWVADGSKRLPDGNLDAALEQISRTRQRRATWWSALQLPEVNTAVQFGILAAALAVVTIFGLSYLVAPNLGGPADPAASPTEAASASGPLLVYQLAGDIYLARADGTDPTLVAEDGYLSPGNVWSPDGRYFLYQSSGEFLIRDADGRMVSSFPARFGAMFSDHSAWSPDSTRIQGWTVDRAAIEIYSIHGDVEASLPTPDGYSRLYDIGAQWAPDGRSIIAPVQRARAAGEVWELPVDGSAPRQVAPDHAFARQSVTFAPDGRHVAYIRDAGTPEAPKAELFVANGDGSDARLVVEPGRYPAFPEWSPSGDRLAYSVSKGNAVDLVVLDLASGVIQTAIADFSRDGYPPFSWSPTGDEILFAAPGPGGGPSLWTVNVDGTERAVLVEDSVWGELQPVDPAS